MQDSDLVADQLSVMAISPPLFLQPWGTTWRPSHSTSPFPISSIQQTWARSQSHSTPTRKSSSTWRDRSQQLLVEWVPASCSPHSVPPACPPPPSSPAWILVQEEQPGPLGLQTHLSQVRPFSEHLPVMTTIGDCPIFSLPTDCQFIPPSSWPPLSEDSGRLSRVTHPSLPGPEKDGAATSVDAVCTYHPDPVAHGRECDRDPMWQRAAILGPEPADAPCHPEGPLLPGQGQPLCQWWVFMLSLDWQWSLLIPVLFYFLSNKSAQVLVEGHPPQISTGRVSPVISDMIHILRVCFSFLGFSICNIKSSAKGNSFTSSFPPGCLLFLFLA